MPHGTPPSGTGPRQGGQQASQRASRPGVPWRAGAATLGLALLAAACSAHGPGQAGPSGGSRTAGSRTADPATAGGTAAGSPQARSAGPLTLQVSPAPYQLPSGLAREVVLPTGPDLLLAGGLTPRSTSTATVRRLNPTTGSTVRVGRLTVPTHDAAGAMLGGATYVFGGGEQSSVATVQKITMHNTAAHGTATVAGRLPRPRSDLVAVSRGGTAYLLGGYDGAGYDATVLATRDGRRFSVAARLAVPVRYPAVAVAGSQIWVFGGQTSHGITNDIQRIPLPGASRIGTGQTVRARKIPSGAVAGHLPRPTTAAAAFTLGGTLYVAGGQTAPARPGQATASPSATLTTSDAVLRYQPGHPAVLAGRLPVPVANAGAGVLGSTAYLVGGDDGVRPVPTVTELRLVPAAGAIPSVTPGSPLDARTARTFGGAPGAGTGGGLGSGGGTGSGGQVLSSEPWLGPPRGRGHLTRHSDPAALPGDVLIADNHNNRLLVVDPQGRIRWQFPASGDLARGQTFRVPDDAFFSPDGKNVIATEEDDSVISVINIAVHRITYRYGTPGRPGSSANHVSNPDHAMLLPGGDMLSADIKNCRILLVRPPDHRPARSSATPAACACTTRHGGSAAPTARSR